jgi:signal transduction histidine kinase
MPPIDVLENKTNEIQGKAGTKIIIKQLKEDWVDKDIKRLSDDLTNLIAPFSSQDDFNIILKKDNELFPNHLREQAKKIKENALFNFDITINNGFISQFNYQFKPWLGLEKVKGRQVNIGNDFSLLKNTLGKKNDWISFEHKLDRFNDLKIGEVNFSGFVYDFDNILFGIQKQMSASEKKPTKDYLKDNGGIRVYRDNFRIFNYGEPGNDFFALDAKRVQRTSGHISSNQILGSIKLNRASSTGLIEKTNREGFINNADFSALQDMLSETFKIIDQLRVLDKDKIMRVYLENAQDRASVESKINDIKNTINESNLEQKQKDKINKNLESFSKDFSQTKEIFMNAANAGLSLSIVVHELDKIINNLEGRIKEQNWEEVPNIAKYLQTTVNAYKDTIKIEKRKSTASIDDIIEKTIFNVGARFKFHQIKIVQDLSEGLNVIVKKNLIIGVLNNLFDNAIYWLEYQNIQDKKILIKSYKKDKQIHLLIADNGKGFTIDFESATRPFITGRRDETSMGIGLHLANMIMEAHQGFLVQGDFDEEKLPEEFKDGAIIKLIFKEVENV